MTRMSKKGKRRNLSPRRPKTGSVKTGPKKDQLELGYKMHLNALSSESNQSVFIPKIK
jgi:hypothetical protein